MFITGLCGPGLVYIGFSLIQIFIDIYNGVMNMAFLKFIIMIVFTLIINILCDLGFSVIAWILVFIPIIMMTIISTLLLQVFGLDSENDNIKSKKSTNTISNVDLVQHEVRNSDDAISMNNRIDRDKLRKTFYHNIDHYYDLSNNNQHIYDLSNNPIKYILLIIYSIILVNTHLLKIWSLLIYIIKYFQMLLAVTMNYMINIMLTDSLRI